jgi:nucleoside-diphosphate-sugar epimerase
MRILITGASGFLGQAVLRELVRGHHQIRVLALPGTERAIAPTSAVQIISGSLQDAGALARATKGIEVAVHMAGALPGSALAEIWRTNVEGTQRLARSCARNQVRRVLFTSSTSVYARASLPYARDITESERVRLRARNRIELYGLSKARAEEALLEAHRQASMEYTIVRSPVIYGSRNGWDRKVMERLRMSSRRALAGAPEQRTLQWLHVEDFARAIAAAVADKRAANQVFNIAGAALFSAEDIVLEFRALELGLAGRQRRRFAPEVLRYAIDKARSRLDFNPAVDLREGCRRILTMQ